MAFVWVDNNKAALNYISSVKRRNIQICWSKTETGQQKSNKPRSGDTRMMDLRDEESLLRKLEQDEVR